MHPEYIKAKRAVEAANRDLRSKFNEQGPERDRAHDLIAEGEQILRPLDAELDPLREALDLAQDALQEVCDRRLGPWQHNKPHGWINAHRYRFGQEKQWYADVAWLRVGTWTPTPTWYVDVKGEGRIKIALAADLTNEQAIHKADEILSSLGWLLED